MKVQRCEQHIIKLNTDFGRFIDDYCFKSKNLYNYANYIIRQEFITNNNWIRYNKLFEMVKDSEPYKEIGSNTGQATLRMLDKAWKAFFVSIKDWKKNPSKYLGMPKMPRYKPKDGRYTLALDSNKVKLKDGYVYFAWNPFKPFNNRFKTKVRDRIIQCRFIPKGNHYVMEIVYEIDTVDCLDFSERIISIDVGVENFVSVVNNFGEQPFVVKGGVIKSINQYYNKKKSEMQSELKKVNGNDWSKGLQKLTDKRYEKIKNYMHCVSKYIIDYCVLYDVDTLVIGHNNGWTQNTKNMQNFTYIPYELFFKILKYKCENKGIKYNVIEESYTSGTSFLDSEIPCKENYNKDRRIQRGLFISNNNIKINADINAAYQIMKKAFPNVFSDGIEGVGLHPLIVNVAS